ncbi:hypothetical protein K402DRAFT_367335 [Aulographum hederae CBS 113979]|uniref:C2H2-type domain-containing protein n=1 Tax=Aulographum hederae CBS 113979 TaxID=1176131 RepID=A0A6G1HFR4_9PEZI|nr:hypothetical protein K402DRAFT_367335 [Aulographum hederae CBS 113979]
MAPREGNGSATGALLVKRKAEEYHAAPEKRLRSDDEKTFNNLDPDSAYATDDEANGSFTATTPLDSARSTPSSSSESDSEPVDISNKFPCTWPNCNRKFRKPCYLKDHILKHKNIRHFKCVVEDCDEAFFRRSHLLRHHLYKHSSERKLVCTWPECNRTFVDPIKLNAHINAHEKKFLLTCSGFPPCQETFRKKETLEAHIAKVHLNVLPFACEYEHPNTGEKCGQRFARPAHLKSHHVRIHEKDSRGKKPTIQHECEPCSLEISSASELKYHNTIHHGPPASERKNYSCPHKGCKHSYTANKNLLAHLRVKHAGDSFKFVCGETVIKNLSIPADTERNIDLTAWDTAQGCGKFCSYKEALKNHIRMEHFGLPSMWAAKQSDDDVNSDTTTPNRKKKRGGGGNGKIKEVDLIQQLTRKKTDYDDGRDLKCPVPGCWRKFYREYDVQVHLKAKRPTGHGLDDQEMDALLKSINAALNAPATSNQEQLSLKEE